MQEAVTNVIKHSAATEATVVVKKQATAVSISIRDNGQGFDPARPSTQTHDFGYGLSGIAERVRILKGTLVIESPAGRGLQPDSGNSIQILLTDSQTMKQGVTVLIVDDHPLLRHGLCDVIAKSPRFKIVGEASDGKEALRKVAFFKPEIVILDIDMPRLNGLETIRAIDGLGFPTKVIILTMYKEEEMFDAAMDLGAKAYVLKENAPQEIVAALEKVEQGETFLSASLLKAGQRRSDRVRDLLLNKPQIEALTPAERRILKLIGDDFTSKQIAERLNLSVRTVDKHRQHICDKLNLHGTHSLLKFAFDNSAYL